MLANRTCRPISAKTAHLRTEIGGSPLALRVRICAMPHQIAAQRYSSFGMIRLPNRDGVWAREARCDFFCETQHRGESLVGTEGSGIRNGMYAAEQTGECSLRTVRHDFQDLRHRSRYASDGQPGRRCISRLKP